MIKVVADDLSIAIGSVPVSEQCTIESFFRLNNEKSPIDLLLGFGLSL